MSMYLYIDIILEQEETDTSYSIEKLKLYFRNTTSQLSYRAKIASFQLNLAS